MKNTLKKDQKKSIKKNIIKEVDKAISNNNITDQQKNSIIMFWLKVAKQLGNKQASSLYSKMRKHCANQLFLSSNSLNKQSNKIDVKQEDNKK